MKTDKGSEPITMKEQCQLSLLATPLFVVSVGLLVLNDFVLKAVFHNWLTGKISDIAGLIAFTLFGCAIWPSRRWVVGATVSAGFVLWKLPHLQPVIDFMNSVLPFSIGRTPDYSDYIALLGVWMVCMFIFRLRTWPIRSWLVGVMAVLSLAVFTATSYIPMHRITRTALVPSYGDQRPIPVVEKQLQDLFDDIADQHGLRCMVCDPLSSGRLYVKNEDRHTDFSLVVNFDPHRAIVFFDASSMGPHADNNAREIDFLHTEIKNQLQTLFPGLKTAEGKRPKGRTLQLGVRKKNSKGSYETLENQEDYNKAIAVIDYVVSRLGLKRSTSRSRTVFYTGRLFGPWPSDRELVVDVSIADWPLVCIDITSYSVQYSELQRNIADELERELQAVFGKERAWVRWGSRR